ncbi:MAG TPA: (Fe-S)-binding protein [Candidatus Dormibacteraeota bacterium]|nr:(Fe-S)-binding protein [Candidatus Dormibacteraeota bacterium]
MKPAEAHQSGALPAKVQLFHTCLINEVFPEVGMSVVRVLEKLGIEVEVPLRQTCCGQPAYNAGFQADAKKVARHMITVLHQADGPIVIPSGSCADMVIHQYAVLFQDDEKWLAKAHSVAARCHEFSSFLVDVVGLTQIGARVRARIAYHPSCHLSRGLGVQQQPRELLRAVAGVEMIELRESEECCGFGGLFSVKNPEISGSMMNRKLAAVECSNAERLVSCDMGCLLQLAGGLHRRGSSIKTQHLAQLLDEGMQ